jgi:hypothetical protein
MAYIDFAELKARLPIEEAIARLDLTVADFGQYPGGRLQRWKSRGG